jgi:hypothetical protein
MTSPSPNPSAKNLRDYLAWIEFWDPECGDGFVLLNAREWLEAHRDALSAEALATVAQADAQVLTLARDAVGDSPDIGFLRLTAQVIDTSAIRPRAG